MALRRLRPALDVVIVDPTVLDTEIATRAPSLVIHGRADDPDWPATIPWLALPADGIGVVRLRHGRDFRVLSPFGFAELLNCVDEVVADGHRRTTRVAATPVAERLDDASVR